MKRIYLFLPLLLAALSATPADAQSACASLADRKVPTAAQWAQCFQSKQDFLGVAPILPANLLGVAPITATPSGIFVTFGILNGTSVANPGTGTLEQLIPIQTTTAASKVFAAADLYKETRRSNGGSAMTDTFPSSATVGLVNGTRIIIANFDTTATDTVTAGAGTTINGGASDTVGPGRAIAYVYDAPATQWRRTLNTGSALLSANNLSDVASVSTSRTNLGLNPGTGLASVGGNLNISNTITAGGPTGSATVVPILTWNAQGQLTVVSSATITPAWSSITGTTHAIAFGNIVQIGANTLLGNWTGSTADIAANTMPSCADAGGNHLNYVLGTGVTCGNTSSGAAGATLSPPQGRVTLQTGVPVMTTSQSAKGTLFYDCYVGTSVPYYNGSTDTFDTITSCEVSAAMVSAASAGQVVSGQVYDAFWVHTGANRLCVAMSAAVGGGGGWAFDAGGLNTGRGTGFSAIDRTRGYWTNTNAIANCFNGATNYGSVPAHQATYLGTFFATANGQTSYVLGSNATGGGQAASLYLWNAYNRVDVKTSVSDSVAFWTIVDGNVHSFNNDVGTRLNFVTGLAEDSVGVALYDQICNVTNPNNPIMAIGFALDRSGNTTFDKIAIQYMNSASVAQSGQVCGSLSVNSTYNNLSGVHFVQALGNQDGQATAWTGQYYGGTRTSFDGYFRM